MAKQHRELAMRLRSSTKVHWHGFTFFKLIPITAIFWLSTIWSSSLASHIILIDSLRKKALTLVQLNWPEFFFFAIRSVNHSVSFTLNSFPCFILDTPRSPVVLIKCFWRVIEHKSWYIPLRIPDLTDILDCSNMFEIQYFRWEFHSLFCLISWFLW